jgi:hypothetical protein
MKLSKITLSIMTFSIMTFSIMTFSIMTFSIMTFSIMTFSIMTFCIMSFSIMTFGAFAECHYADCRRYVQTAKCHYAECRYTKCHGAHSLSFVKSDLTYLLRSYHPNVFRPYGIRLKAEVPLQILNHFVTLIYNTRDIRIIRAKSYKTFYGCKLLMFVIS